MNPTRIRRIWLIVLLLVVAAIAGTLIIATGKMQGKKFIASEVLAKHDETYTPKEVKDAMEKAKALHTKSCGAL